MLIAVPFLAIVFIFTLPLLIIWAPVIGSMLTRLGE
jgi:hypothetical protein